MKNDRVVAFVYETENYAKFRKLKENRSVDKGRLSKLVASFSVKSILAPIVVNKRNEIIDGQGRYEARKLLGLPIQYVVDAKADIDDCRRMNHYNTAWDALDFVKSYAEAGKSDYCRLLALCDENKIGIMLALALSDTAKSAHMDRLYSGDLNFSTKDMESIRNVMGFAKDLQDTLQITGRLPQVFYRAVKVILNTDGFDKARMLKNAEKYRFKFAMMANLADMLGEFTEIYNLRKRTDDRIYFTDYMRNKGWNIRTYDENLGVNRMRNVDVSTLKK